MGKEVIAGREKSAGAVIEVRLNAEDPYSGFTPAPGEVLLFAPPAGPGVRVDSGIEQSSSILSDFDSMAAKIIAYGKDRNEALARIKRAVEELRIKIKNGTTNRSFILDLLNNPQIVKGGIHTGFVREYLESRSAENSKPEEEASLFASAVEIYLRHRRDEMENFKNQISSSGSPRTLSAAAGDKIDLTYNGCSYSFFVKYTGDSYYHIRYLDKEYVCRYRVRGEESVIESENTVFNLILTDRGDIVQCDINGLSIPVSYQSGGVVKSRSPAVVLSVNTEKDAYVEKGDPLIVLEAMKMEMIISAPASGTVSSIFISEGEQISAGQPLLLIDESSMDEEAVSGTPVDFSSFLQGNEKNHMLKKRDLTAFFLGYDNEKDAVSVWKDFYESSMREKYPEKILSETILYILDLYIRVEKLFSAEELVTELFSRSVTYQEMLSHYFRIRSDKSNGLPEGFTSDVDSALNCIGFNSSSSDSDPDFYFFNIFRSHKNRSKKDEILKLVFSAVEKIEFSDPDKLKMLSLLNDLITLFPSSSVSYYAVSARYNFFDRNKLEAVKAESIKKLESVIHHASESLTIPEKEKEFLIDSGSYIIPEIIELSLSEDRQKRKLGYMIAGLRFNRDRAVIKSSFSVADNAEYFSAEINGKSSTYKSFLSVIDEKYLYVFDAEAAVNCKSEKEGSSVKNELILLVKCSDESCSSDALFESILSRTRPADIKFSIGVYADNETIHYRTYSLLNNQWAEINLMRDFSPLQFRELKVGRFSDFSLNILYRRESVFVAEICSKINSDDVRLVSFVDVSEMLPSETEDDNRIRLLMFEALFNEAAGVMRSLHGKSRNMWNRIIVHNRTLLGIRFKTLQEYGSRMMKQSGDIGLERFTVLTRRKRWSEDFVRNVEFDFVPAAGNQIIIRRGAPQDRKIESLDSYTSKVINSKRKHTVYPYEIIKFLTGDASSVSGIISGSFEEYDIEYESGSDFQKAVSVKGREPGLNSSNIVFGIIENILSKTGASVRRVIILSDAAKDMGSLAEEEARRVSAALDLAEDENIPVEWIPVSSGARIDMKSGTENLDWTAVVLRRIINFTQNGGEINIIVSAANVGAQSYWNAESTMLMHTKGLLIMTDDASMLLTGKKALDFSGSVSGETNTDIGGAEKIMGPNGQAQIRVSDLSEAFKVLFRHYSYTYISLEHDSQIPFETADKIERDISFYPYSDSAGQGFKKIGDIFDFEKNPERKKPFDMRQVMNAVIDSDAGYIERWKDMHNAETSIVWETQIGGIPAGMIGIESRTLSRIGEIPFDGPENWNGGTLYPLSSKKTARALNAFSGVMPVVILANLSGFDGSPESLKKLQLEYGAEIGRAVVNFKGPIVFIVTARYHGGAYVVFSKKLNPGLTAAAIEGSFASVIGGAPAAAVVFPRKVRKETYNDIRIIEASEQLKKKIISVAEFDDCFKKVYNERQRELGKEFDRIHSVERAKKVGSIDDIVSPEKLRPYIIGRLLKGQQSVKEF